MHSHNGTSHIVCSHIHRINLGYLSYTQSHTNVRLSRMTDKRDWCSSFICAQTDWTNRMKFAAFVNFALLFEIALRFNIMKKITFQKFVHHEVSVWSKSVYHISLCINIVYIYNCSTWTINKLEQFLKQMKSTSTAASINPPNSLESLVKGKLKRSNAFREDSAPKIPRNEKEVRTLSFWFCIDKLNMPY
jgi:hypothetical protein